jgi:hypothetical protein
VCGHVMELFVYLGSLRGVSYLRKECRCRCEWEGRKAGRCIYTPLYPRS